MTGQGQDLSEMPGPRPGTGASDTDQARMAFVLHLRERGIASVDVLRALETVPRERFVPRRYADLAWRDIALPIACGQIMPDPYVVARTMEALALDKSHRVLEIGAGSGYATAILARLAGEVVSFERYRSLAIEAQERIKALGIANVQMEWEDGLAVASQHGEFHRILVHMSLEQVPPKLESLLLPGGRIVFGRPARDNIAAGLVVCRRQQALAGSNNHGPQGQMIEAPVAEVRLSAPEAGCSQAL